MIVKKYKDIYQEVANKLDLPYSTIFLIGEFIYGKLSESMTNMEYREIYMYKLGSFRFRIKKSLEYIRKYRNMKQRMLKMGKSLESAEKGESTVNNKVERMNKLLAEYDMIVDEKKKHKQKREQYDASRNIQQ